MLSQMGNVAGTMKGLGVLASTQRPFVQFLIKNWPLAMIAGYALFVRGKDRWNKGELNAYNAFADAGLILTPLVGLALLNNLAQEDQKRIQATQAAQAVATAPATGSTSEADAISAAVMQAAAQAASPPPASS